LYFAEELAVEETAEAQTVAVVAHIVAVGEQIVAVVAQIAASTADSLLNAQDKAISNLSCLMSHSVELLHIPAEHLAAGHSLYHYKMAADLYLKARAVKFNLIKTIINIYPFSLPD